MKKHFSRQILLSVLIIGQLSAFPAKSFAQDSSAETKISSQASLSDDAAIAQRLRSIYGEIDGLGSVTVYVASGVVTLKGTVGNGELVDEAETLAKRVEGVVAVSNEISEETSIDERLTPALQRGLERVKEAVRYLPLVGVALLVWMAFVALGWFVTSRNWPWNRLAPNVFIADLMRQLVWIVFVLFGALVALDLVGAATVIGTVLGAAGIVGLAVGFAVRDTVENYLASILLSLRQPFRPKDFVAIEGQEGFVTRLTSRATILLDASGNHVRIPNAVVFKATIINYTRNPERRFDFALGVDAESQLDQALSIGIQCLRGLDFTLERPPADGWIETVGDSNIVLRFCGWIDQRSTDFMKARSEALRLTKNALETAGFSLPEPIYRVNISAMPEQVLLNTNLSGKSSEPVQKAPIVKESSEGDVSADQAISDQIDDERQGSGSRDLLSDEGPSELG